MQAFVQSMNQMVSFCENTQSSQRLLWELPAKSNRPADTWYSLGHLFHPIPAPELLVRVSPGLLSLQSPVTQPRCISCYVSTLSNGER